MDRKRNPALGFPILLILGGLGLLAYNFGIIDWSPVLAMLTLWPLLMIAIGIDLMTGYAPRWLAAMVSLLVLGGLSVLAVLTEEGRIGTPPPVGEAREVSIPAQGAESARLRVRFYDGEVRLAAAPAGAGELIRGSVYTKRSSDLSIRHGQSDATADISIRNRPRDVTLGPLGPHRSQLLDLRLSREVPLDMTLEGFVSEINLDLTRLQLRALDIGLDAGHGRVKLPSPAGEVKADIDLDFGDLLVLVPSDVPARIRVSSDVSSISIDKARFPHLRGRSYESPDYATAEHRWNITIRAGLGIVRIR
jgi:hypothetical protein